MMDTLIQMVYKPADGEKLNLGYELNRTLNRPESVRTKQPLLGSGRQYIARLDSTACRSTLPASPRHFQALERTERRARLLHVLLELGVS